MHLPPVLVGFALSSSRVTMRNGTAAIALLFRPRRTRASMLRNWREDHNFLNFTFCLQGAA
jgi:hypothetical protein